MKHHGHFKTLTDSYTFIVFVLFIYFLLVFIVFFYYGCFFKHFFPENKKMLCFAILVNKVLKIQKSVMKTFTFFARLLFISCSKKIIIIVFISCSTILTTAVQPPHLLLGVLPFNVKRTSSPSPDWRPACLRLSNWLLASRAVSAAFYDSARAHYAPELSRSGD